MATPDHNSADVLREQILADARRESEAIIWRVRREAEELLAKARTEAARIRQERLAQAQAEANRRSELILATVPVEAGRLRAARVEMLLEAVRDKVRQQLLARDGLNYREVLIALAAEAASQMSGEVLVVRLSSADRMALGEGLAGEITRRVGRSPLGITVSEDTAITGGGLIIGDAAGRQVWDNRLATRLERLWPELRRQIAILASLVTHSSPPGGGT